MSERRWYRLHWATWVAALGVVALLAYCQVPCEAGDAPLIFPGWLDVTEHGWPLLFAERRATGPWLYGPPGLRQGPAEAVDYRIATGPLLWNIGAWVAMLVGTLVAAEVWCRRSRRLQFRLVDLLAVVAVAAVLLGWWYHDYHQFDGFRHPKYDTESTIAMIKLFRSFSRSAFLGDWIPWYVRTPLIFIVGCTIYTAGWLGAQGVRGCFKLVARA